MTTGTSRWRETGDTDVSSLAKALARSIGAGSSPMAGEASAIHGITSRWGLTRLAAAMAWHETKNWTWHCGTAPAGEPCIPEECRNAWAMKEPGTGRWWKFPTFAEAARTWAQRLTDPAGPYAQTRTIEELIRVYAPAWADGGNDVGTYVATVCREIDRLPRSGGASVSNPFREPAIYELYRDYAGFGMTQAQATKVGNNKFPGRNGMRPSAILLHVQEGTTITSLNWWATGADVQASSTVMVQKDASVLRVIPEADAPWTNGDVKQPTGKGRILLNRLNGANPNLVTLSVEMEGYSGEQLADGVIETLCWVCWDWMTRYPIGIADIYRHADLNSVTRGQCPGSYYDVVLGRLRAAQGGDAPAPAWPGKPSWLPDSMVVELFPEASPSGPRTAAWLRYCSATGRAPRRVKFHYVGTSAELIEFSDGALIDRSGKVLA